MRKLSSGILVALAVLAIPPAPAATANVDITQAGFTPSKVTVKYGDTVTWTNKDRASHQVLADQLAFPTSPVLAANQTYSYTFTKSGSFGYRDHVPA
jgi:plastocyanin